MTSVSAGDLVDEFECFGVELSIDDDDIIDKLKGFCSIYRLDASDLSSEWIAFVHSRKAGPKNISAELLDVFERERLNKKISKLPKTPKVKKEGSSVIYDLETLPEAVHSEEQGDGLLDTYSTPSFKGGQNKKRQLTPDNLPIKRLTGKGRSPVVPFSPASFSPANATPSRKYGSRTTAGDVVASYGNADKVSWKREAENTASITPWDLTDMLDKPYKFMFQKLADKAHVLNDGVEELAQYLQTHHKIEEFSHVALPVQDEVTVCGRICCDSQGKLNAKSVVLEGSRETSAGRCIPIDLSELKEYSLFPGQVVAFDGINITGQKFVTRKLHKGVPPPQPEKAVKIEADEVVNVMVATGPFSTSDNMMYEPLGDLYKYLQRDQPHLLILMGPFVDSKNEEVEKGTLETTFEEVFQRKMDEISILTQRIQCEVVVVPSQRDVHHDYVYPQPPFRMNSKHKHVRFVSDPCTLRVNNTVIGLTSTDVLLHLSGEEISGPSGSSDRLGRLAKHLLTQHSYYPLNPPSEEVNIDYDKLELYARLPVNPHVLLVPSDLRYFIKDIDGCCCVNPGRLAKGHTGGTYARLRLQPSDKTDSRGVEVSGQVIRV
ncbi:DNA polymerase alpha subunit B-like [Liolophura sinensis]|uniref:DNA polymerase alpha subunit B-like n=1 Tax=Liolophura sinensis TaxID=3198878 RepID=UPI003157FABD